MKKYTTLLFGIVIIALASLAFWQMSMSPTESDQNTNPPDTENPTPSVPSEIEELKNIQISHQENKIKSPVTITGQARGTWYFEASFPVKVLDANNQELGVSPAQAQGDWMTEEFVPFSVTINFSNPSTPTGFLMFEKDNPSGLTEHDKSYKLPIVFAE